MNCMVGCACQPQLNACVYACDVHVNHSGCACMIMCKCLYLPSNLNLRPQQRWVDQGWIGWAWCTNMSVSVCVREQESPTGLSVFVCCVILQFCRWHASCICRSMSEQHCNCQINHPCLQHRSMCAWVRTDCLRLHQKASSSTIKPADLNDQRDTDADFKDERCWFVDVNVGTIFYSIIKDNAMWTYRILEKHANFSPELQEHTLSTPQSRAPRSTWQKACGCWAPWTRCESPSLGSMEVT